MNIDPHWDYEDEFPYQLSSRNKPMTNQPNPIRGQLIYPEDINTFLFAGSATLTLHSKKSGKHFTYKVSKKDKDKPDSTFYFVSVLTGPDNSHDYKCIARFVDDVLYKNNKTNSTSQSWIAFSWFWQNLQHCLTNQLAMPADLQIFHEGRCGRCNKKLTVPESVATGFGPECAGKV